MFQVTLYIGGYTQALAHAQASTQARTHILRKQPKTHTETRSPSVDNVHVHHALNL